MSLTADKVAKLAELSVNAMKQTLSDWDEMTGFGAELKGLKARLIKDPAGLKVQDGSVTVETQVETSTGSGPMRFILPCEYAAEAVGLMLMLPPDTIKEKAATGLEEGDLLAVQELANLMCGSSNRAYQRLDRDLRVSQAVDHLRVIVNQGDNPCGLEPEAHVVLDMTIEVGGTSHQIQQISSAILSGSIAGE